MRIVSLAFVEFPDQDCEWRLEKLTFNAVNLIVGKNATGKTRAMNVINFLSKLLSGQQEVVFSRGSYEVVFEDGDNNWQYSLEFDNFVVTKEGLVYNGDSVLDRGQGGYGRILAEDIDGKPVRIKFDVPGSRVAVFAKRDDAQHAFLRPLHEWAASVRHFGLGGDITPQALALALKQPIPIPINEKKTSQLVPIFDKARRELGADYLKSIVSDMKELGYDIDDIDIRRPTHLVANAILPGELVGVSFKENDLRCYVDQPSISQGMFRAFSLLAQVNYYVMSSKDVCILADDVGEGLDFDRSCALIDVLRRKVYESSASTQLIMTTNDRFVMNRVPLEEWTVLQRKGHRVRVRNYENSKAEFDEFKYTGLSNFDFLATDFLDEESEVEAASRE